MGILVGGLKTGPSTYELPPYSRATVVAEGHIAVYLADTEGELLELLATGSGKVAVRSGDRVTPLYIKVADGAHWSLYLDDFSAVERPDPTPVEVPEELVGKVSLEDRLKEFVAGLVAERYGRGSEEMESLEEAWDFGEDDEEDPLLVSPYEVQDMIEEEPIPPGGDSGGETPSVSEQESPEGGAPEADPSPPDPPAKPSGL